MDNPRILSALSYFSVLFAPFLLPIIVYFVSQDPEVKYHAKKSLISHIIPVVLLVILFISIFSSFMPFTTGYNEQPTLWMAVGPLILIGIYMLVYVIVMVWNIVQGIKVLR
ncbi:DUF4870 domain-containing protein [Psychrobacillus sp. FSL H8-0487]|uniref:DUF4870 domain-containing protein n=1 Tax=Psychrobacillus sp. FSL H8-0487 TaxID=2921391 RepID=UPI0030FAF5D7